jgi:hypothetical protein
VSAYPDRLSAVKARLGERSCGDTTCTDDLRWAIDEIDYLRFYLTVLGDLAWALDAFRWALENPKPGRVARRRRAYEEALQELLATPNWRPGECQSGCRRYATHELVLEREDRSVREPRCEECGRRDVACWTALAAGHVPAVPARLDPLAGRRDQAGEGGQ